MTHLKIGHNASTLLFPSWVSVSAFFFFFEKKYEVIKPQFKHKPKHQAVVLHVDVNCFRHHNLSPFFYIDFGVKQSHLSGEETQKTSFTFSHLLIQFLQGWFYQFPSLGRLLSRSSNLRHRTTCASREIS